MAEENNTQQTPPAEPGTGENGLDLSGAGKEQAQPSTVVPPIPDPAAKISEDLSRTAGGVADMPENEADPLEVLLAGIKPDQLQRLKMLLDATPTRISRRTNPVVLLRKHEGNFIVDIGSAVNTLQRNDFTNITTEVLMLPVKFLGAGDFTMMPWQEYMQAEQVKCEIVSRRSKPDRQIVGDPIMHRDTGKLVENVITTLEEFFTIKLPEGSPVSTIEIPVKMANA